MTGHAWGWFFQYPNPNTQPPGVAVGVGVAEGVAVGVGVTLGVTEGVAEGLGVTLGVTDGVTLGVTEGVALGVLDVGVEVGVTLGVVVAVGVGVPPPVVPTSRKTWSGASASPTQVVLRPQVGQTAKPPPGFCQAAAIVHLDGPVLPAPLAGRGKVLPRLHRDPVIPPQ